MKAKSTRKNITPQSWWILNEKTAPPILALGAMIGVILLTLLFRVLVQPKQGNEAATTNGQASALTITTGDGIILSAELHYPVGSAQFPVIILLHEFGQDRSQWNPYREFFISEGFAVVQYDIRGFGESALASIPTAQGSWFSSMPNDLTAVVKYAASQSKIDEKNIYVVGVGLGANIAYVGSGTVPSVHKTVLLFSTMNPQLDGSTFDNFFPQNVLGIANTADQSALNSVMDRVQGVGSQSIILDDPTDRGLGILEDETVRSRIINWLRQ